MTDVAMENQTVDKKPNKFAMLIPPIFVFPLAAVLLVHPAAMLDDNGHYSHSAPMYIMIGISGGFIHGVGFVPRHWIWAYGCLARFYRGHWWSGVITLGSSVK